MSDPPPLLAAHGVSKRYRIGKRDIPVLDSVDLEVGRGDFLALRGSSGAGKSTLLHLLGALDRPNQGRIEFEGQDLATLPGRRLIRFRNLHVGFVFQAYHLFPEFDACENVALPARMARRPGREVREKARNLLDRVGLGDRMNHRPAELSGGEQQRVAIARALVNDPDLLLADEPTGNLDSRTGGSIIDLLESLQREYGLTLLMATHDDGLASRAPRRVQLVDGRVAEVRNSPGPESTEPDNS